MNEESQLEACRILGRMAGKMEHEKTAELDPEEIELVLSYVSLLSMENLRKDLQTVGLRQDMLGGEN